VSIKKFHEIFAIEAAAITRRRKLHGRPAIVLEEEGRERDGTPVMRPRPASNVVGLALSGGGIRSASFCLGAMQALDAWRLIEKIDYLSTVSGGGYIGTSMTAAMSEGTAGKFPFASKLVTGEEPGVQHIRDHSNYLFPQGLLNIFGNVGVYLRGVLANVVLLLPWLLLGAAFTLYSNPNVAALTETKVANHLVRLPIRVDHFGLTANALLVFVVLLVLWALWRSTSRGRNISDVGISARFFAVLSVVLLVVAFFELQPWLLDGMFKIAKSSDGGFFARHLRGSRELLLSLHRSGPSSAFSVGSSQMP
jgi:Patatin-like phospholipase